MAGEHFNFQQRKVRRPLCTKHGQINVHFYFIN